MKPLILKPAKTEEAPIGNTIPVLSSFLPLVKRSWWQRWLWYPKIGLSLECFSYQQKTRFSLVPPLPYLTYMESQLLSQYPKTLTITEQDDVLPHIQKAAAVEGGTLTLAYPYAFPLQTYKEAGESDLLANVWGFLGKLAVDEMAFIQVWLAPTQENYWQSRFRNVMHIQDSEGNETASPYKSLFEKKIGTPLVEVQIRLCLASLNAREAQAKMMELAGAFGSFSRAEGNTLRFHRVASWQLSGFLQSVIQRKPWFFSPTFILNLEEVAGLWHLPGKLAEHIKGIDWGKTLLSEAPEHTPVAELVHDEEEKRTINFFAQTEWRNHPAIFGIKQQDRRKHIYIIGKTGTGKSTLMANMAINDIRNDKGVAIIDPHGDTAEMLLNYIPKRRINDIVYLDPTLANDRAFSLNLFDVNGTHHTDVIASGIVSVFQKLYQHSWGPRLEYILRNCILSLLYFGEATFADIPALLTHKPFRQKVVAKIAVSDPVLAAFWNDEFEQMNDKLRTEAISPILNKVGQFLSAQRIRQVVGMKESTFSLAEIMNEGKVLILNLSQGKLGEDTAALLGAMFITKLQLTAMERVAIPENERKDFYLYVDEFQNFATQSFIKILSEARKYRLNLILANQYIGQVDEQIQKAIFGNVGTLITFLLGATDAGILEKEFGSVFKADDLVALKNFEIILKMSINDLTSEPFLAKTLPLPSVVNDNREKILRVALEKYYHKV